MALNPEQNRKLTDILMALVQGRDELNEWERSFLQDQINRHEMYGQNVWMSEKQWTTLDKMFEKVTGEPYDEPPLRDELSI